ncbi:unnamed protein product [Arabidopsis thaliana]|uniref:Uncharacterized protein n=1 Tax=Arabidopsis thaliana TaxID=3702 RepID=Q9LJT4_ARATH|nr:unnamed protein product [Arabidopsis thaliana]
MSDFEDSQNKSNHNYGDDESSSETRSAASPQRVQRRVITLGGIGPIRPPSIRADKPKKKKAAKQGGGTRMTNSDLVDLRRRCQVPVGVTMILPRPPLHHMPELCPPCIGVIHPAREVDREFNCHDLLQLCQVKTNARSDQGTYYISARPGSLILGGLKAYRDTNWRSKYFLFRTNWATFSRDRIVAAHAVASVVPLAPAVPAIVLPAAQLDPIEEVVLIVHRPLRRELGPSRRCIRRLSWSRSSGRSHGGGRGSRGGGRSSNRTQKVRQTSNSGGGSAGSGPFHWSNTHDRDHPIVDDEAGLANLLRHIKGRNCQVPGVKNMAKAASYADMMAKEGQAIAATNKLVALYEQRLSQVPSASELEEGKTLIRELTSSVKAGGDREVENRAVHFKRPRERLCCEDRAHGDGDRGVASRQADGEEPDSSLGAEEGTALQKGEVGLQKGVHDVGGASGRGGVKPGFDRPDHKGCYQSAVEKPRLQAELDDLEVRCKSKEVSDFTLSKLDLPQVSEISVVRLMDVDEQGTPIGLDEFESNKDAFPGGLAEGSGTVFATPAGESRLNALEGFYPFVYCFLNLVPGKAFILCSFKYLDAWEGFYPF